MVTQPQTSTGVKTICTCCMQKLLTSLNSSLWATASKHSCPVLSTESVNSTKSPLSCWIRVTRQLLLETVYLLVLLSLKPNGKGMFLTLSQDWKSLLGPERLSSSVSSQRFVECFRVHYRRQIWKSKRIYVTRLHPNREMDRGDTGTCFMWLKLE